MKPIIHRVGEKLTAAERDKLLIDLAETRLEHTRIKDEKREEDRTYNEQLNVLDDKIQLLAESARDNKKYEDVEVRHEADDEKLEITVYRLDNDEEILTRPMDDDEKEEAAKRRKNPTLPFEGAPKRKTIYDATPDRVKHHGQDLQKVKRAKGKGKGKGKEARP